MVIVEELLGELREKLSGSLYFSQAVVQEAANGVLERLKDSPPESVTEFILAGLRLLGDGRTWESMALQVALGNLLRRKLPFSEAQVEAMVESVTVVRASFPYRRVLKAAETVQLTSRLAEALRRLRPCITEYHGSTEMRELHGRIDDLLHGGAPAPKLRAEGAWTEVVFAEIAGSAVWEKVFLHGLEVKSAEASKKWRLAAQKLADEVGREAFLDAALRWLALGPSPKRPGVQLTALETDFQKGFLWFLADFTDPRLPALIATFTEGALKKIPQFGAVSQRVGNASVNVLEELPGMVPVAQLCRLGQRIRYDTAQRLIEEALNRAAEKAGVSRVQLEEMTVPDCGLGPEGKLTERFGDYVAQISIEDTISAAVVWTGPEGKVLKGVPAAAKAEWKELSRTVKDMEKLLGAHRTRIERLLLTQRAIPTETLRTCYLEHPLLSDMTRRLIWQFDDRLGIWHDGLLVDDAGRPIDFAAQKFARLWHPLSSDLQTILHWRCWLEDHGVRQPFKQAHREVYILTDAERETAVYSARFAGHILKQHQFTALCAQRGWDYRLMGPFDSHNVPVLDLPQYGLQAFFEVDVPRDESISPMGIFLLVASGWVRFSKPLEQIPPIVFSEVMRDGDLFTSVASVTNDPAWGLRTPTPFDEYWKSFSFGELSEIGHTRRTVLERLIPRLAIRDRCRIEDRFLIVRGDRALYKIHLGSGNVVMEPGSQYLCIVEAHWNRTKPGHIALPFEGDHTLTMILSKAFLLADDRAIKDPIILRQLAIRQ